MRLAIVTAVWKRPELTRAVLSYYGGLRIEGLEIARYAAISEATEPVPGWEYVEVPNMPLGAKWNAAMERAYADDPDGYLVVGSDDLVEPEYLEFIALHGEDYDWIEPRNLFLYEVGSRRCCEVIRAAPGAGCFFSRSHMERHKGRPYEDELTENIDAGPKRGAGEIPSYRRLKVRGFCILDIKTSENMWDYDFMAKGVIREMDPAVVFARFRGLVTEDQITAN